MTGSWTKMAAVVNYSPPWWVNLLHRLPHFNMEFQIVSSDFRPEDSEYQKVRPALGGDDYLPLGMCHLLHCSPSPDGTFCRLPTRRLRSRAAKWWRRLS